MNCNLSSKNRETPTAEGWGFGLDVHSKKNISCVITNIFLQIISASIPMSYLLNVPFRFFSVRAALKNFEYIQLALNAAAISTLGFPLGRIVTIGIDCLSEVMVHYGQAKKKEEKQDLLIQKMNCEDYENALKAFGLSKEEAKDAGTLDARYSTLQKKWKEVSEKAASSPPLQATFRQLASQVEEAYQTLKKCTRNEPQERRRFLLNEID